MPHLKTITTTEAQTLLNQTSPLIIDLRDAASYDQSHIDGAQLFSDSQITSLIRKGDKTRPVFLYCYKGNKSATVGQMLVDFGFQTVAHLKDGFTAWQPPSRTNSAADAKSLDTVLVSWLEQFGFRTDDINATDDHGQSPLIKACQTGNPEMARHLIELGARVDHSDANGNQALWAACFADSTPLIDLLLAYGADIDHQNESGATALIYSASASKTEITEHLLKKGADPSLTTSDDFSALDLCVNKNCFLLLKQAQKKQ